MPAIYCWLSTNSHALCLSTRKPLYPDAMERMVERDTIELALGHALQPDRLYLLQAHMVKESLWS